MCKSIKSISKLIKAIFTALSVFLVSVTACVPVFAENGGDGSGKIIYKMKTEIGDYVYADSENSRYFCLIGEQINVYDAETGIYNNFYNFKAKSPDPSSFKFFDYYVTESRLYYLYQSGGSSFAVTVDFDKLSVFTNRLGFECESLMGTQTGDVILYSPINNGIYFVIKSDGTTINGSMPVKIEKFYGEDTNGNIYYSSSNGLTYASYNRQAIVPSNKKITNITANLHAHSLPLSIYDKRYISDYTGKVFSLRNGNASLLFSYERPNFSDISYQGFGSETIFIPNTSYAIGMGYNTSIDLFDYRTGEYISSVATEHNIYALVQFGSGVICFEKDSEGCFAEIIPFDMFTSIEATVINLNEESVYKGRTSADAAVKYSSAVSGYNLTEDMLSDNGSSTAPYKRSVMTENARKALLDFSNYHRWLVGLSGYEAGSAEKEKMASMAAILLNASPVQGHYPPKPYDMNEEFYAVAYEGTGGNLSYGHTNDISGGISSIRALTNDSNNRSNQETVSDDGVHYQGYNTPGHRNSFLQRGGSYLSYGVSDRILVQYYEFANADPNYSGTFSENGNNEAAYSWPAPGAFPADELDPEVVWTVYLNTDKVNTSYKNLRITITDLDSGEKFIRDSVMHDADGQREGYSLSNYWGKSISFTPPKTDSYSGKGYNITIENLVDGKGMPAVIEYTVNLFGYDDTFTIDGEEYKLSESGKLERAELPSTSEPAASEPETTEPVTEETSTEVPSTAEPATEAPSTLPLPTVEPTTVPPIPTVEPTTVPPIPTVEPTTVPVNPTVEPTTVPVNPTVEPTTAEPSSDPSDIKYILIGDVNGDGKVNGTDAGILQRYVATWEGYRSRIKVYEACDLNRDGKVNGADAGFLSRYVSGIEQYARFIVQIPVTE